MVLLLLLWIPQERAAFGGQQRRFFAHKLNRSKSMRDIFAAAPATQDTSTIYKVGTYTRDDLEQRPCKFLQAAN